jgi:NADH-quinone oxidoreductase subunit D
MLRASGVKWDLRKARPYTGYDQYDFDIPVAAEGDTYARYVVRIQEFRESMKIIEQALNKLPMGPVRSDNRKFVPPPRSELGVSMEALIHHFKLWTEGFNAPRGSVYAAVESPRGELGVLLEGDGGPKPSRVHWRTPSFDNLSVLPKIVKGHLVADLVAILASVDIVLGDIDR